MKEEGMYDARELAKYIVYKYEIDYKREITPLKLQKSLYLCFAHWGGLIEKGKQADNELNDANLSSHLFKEEIEAWSYGPVVRDVYYWYKDGMLDGREFDDESKKYLPNNIFKQQAEKLFKDNIIVKEFLDDLLDELFKISDFKLVEITHRDKAWQNHFEPLNDSISNIIPHEEIIDEYTQKY